MDGLAGMQTPPAADEKKVNTAMTQVAMPDSDLSSVDPERLKAIYRSVALIVAADRRINIGLKAGEFKTGFYPIRGQEIIPAATTAALRPDDYMVTTYRCLHDVLAKGTPLGDVMAEMLGRVTGTSKGKGGPMHLSDPQSGLMVTTGIVGAGVPIAVGLALSSKLQGSDRVTVASFGDGATSIGAVHEAFNLATVWDLPVLFLLQNNQYGEHTSVEGYTKTTKFSDRAAGYGMRGVTFNGNDPVEVFHAVSEAAERARRGEGPTLLEAVTHRLEGHAFGHKTTYMDQEHLAAAWAADPVPMFRNRLLAADVFTEKELSEYDKEAKRIAHEAVQFALDSDFVSITELCSDIFADEKDVLI
jgi:TPP-dependent pyruvate/acetoin dehydrogenase alpha subunit